MTADAPATPDMPPAPTAEKASVFEDFIDIFASPRAVFERRAKSGFFLVLVIVTLLLGWLFFANRGTMQGIMDAEIARSMAEAMKQNPSMTQEQVAAGTKAAGVMTSIGAFITIPIVILLVGAGAWLTGKIFGATLTYAAATMIAAYAYIPRVVEALAISVQGLLLDTSGFTGRYQLSLGVGRFLDPESTRGLLGVLGRVDVFTLWVTALLAIGIVTVGKLPKEKLIPVGAVMWAVGAIPSLFSGVMALIRG